MYGRLAARRPVGLADLDQYLTDPLPAAPDTVAAPQLADWGMLANDRLGCCTIAGVAHLRMANALEHGEPVPAFTDSQVASTYLTLAHGHDTGLVEASVLHTWQTAGLFGDRIAGYAPVDHRNPAVLRSVVAAFGGAYLGVAMPAPADSQFADGQPWQLTGTLADRQIEGGHCVPAVGYDADHCYVVTWGRLQPVAWSWLAAYMDEAWAVLTSEDARVDLAALQADLARLS